MIIKKEIKTDKKVNPLYARYVIRRDQKMVMKAVDLRRKVNKGMMAARDAIQRWSDTVSSQRKKALK